MYQGYRVGALLLMGGSGVRFGGAAPKQFSLLKGRLLYEYALQTFLEMGLFDEVLLVCHPDWVEKVRGDVVLGGATRQESSFRGLKGFREAPDLVLIHDAVRPFVDERIVRETLEAAIRWGAADTCVPTADTLVYAPRGERIESIPKREEFLRGQTPQTFRYELIVGAHEQAKRKGIENQSDDCRLVLDAGGQVAVVRGNEENFKITTEWDLRMAETLLAIREKKVEEGEGDEDRSDQQGGLDIPGGERGNHEEREDLAHGPHRS